jgi:hypothetical protein
MFDRIVAAIFIQVLVLLGIAFVYWMIIEARE